MDISTIIAELAVKHGLKKNEVAQIVNCQFSFLRKVLADESTSSVKLIFLGKFGVKPRRLVKYEENKQRRLEKLKLEQDVKERQKEVEFNKAGMDQLNIS